MVSHSKVNSQPIKETRHSNRAGKTEQLLFAMVLTYFEVSGHPGWKHKRWPDVVIATLLCVTVEIVTS